ncbi:hypothetical protein E2C01_061834 [Portunus trituberculatus]|uniref:Uncharacterized protein n=1 Tax=Portunus trituberculatus TaxID=210409 RepID=A0A5B7HCB2_PORTR|nr:hypothetical protein [Portunus trituberculatus]
MYLSRCTKKVKPVGGAYEAVGGTYDRPKTLPSPVLGAAADQYEVSRWLHFCDVHHATFFYSTSLVRPADIAAL